MSDQYNIINKIDEFNDLIRDKSAVLVYFSHERCNVCKVLKPKVLDMVCENYPRLELFYVDTEKSPVVAAQNGVFTVPTIKVYFAGREVIKRSRNIGISQLYEAINRSYNMMFE